MKFLLCALTILSLTAGPSFAQTYADPIPYCKAMGTIDKPDSRYTGPKLPAWMAKDLNLKPDQRKLMEWRCAGGAVLACVYGANLPCDSKANTSRKPTEGIVNYCKQNSDAKFVPMVVTGHETTISWACHGSDPAVIHSAPVDAQGYAKAYWKPVSP